jgi:hypothetical protein
MCLRWWVFKGLQQGIGRCWSHGIRGINDHKTMTGMKGLYHELGDHTAGLTYTNNRCSLRRIKSKLDDVGVLAFRNLTTTPAAATWASCGIVILAIDEPRQPQSRGRLANPSRTLKQHACMKPFNLNQRVEAAPRLFISDKPNAHGNFLSLARLGRRSICIIASGNC